MKMSMNIIKRVLAAVLTLTMVIGAGTTALAAGGAGAGTPKKGGKTPADTGILDFVADGWKIQLPEWDPDKLASVMEVMPKELAAGYEDEYFYASTDENGEDVIVFHCTVDGAKTANTSYTRTELRELIDGEHTNVNWGWKGTHTLTAVQSVTHVSPTGKVITSQIHGIEKDGSNANPLVKVAYNYDFTTGTGSVVVELKETTAKSSADKKYTFPNVALGQKYSTEIEVVDGRAFVTIGTKDPDGKERQETYAYDFVAGDPNWKETLYYFKLGNYLQDSKNYDMNEYADVLVYAGKLSHTEEVTPVQVEGLKLSAGSLTLRPGEKAALQASTVPIKATDTSVKWSVVSGGEYVAVDKHGNVTGLKVGTATVRAASVANPDATAECTVTVADLPDMAVEALFETDFGVDAAADLASFGKGDVTVYGESAADATVSLITDGDGNVAAQLKDTGASPAKLAIVFPAQYRTATISFRVRIDELGPHSAKNDPGYLYIVASGSDSWYTNDTELFRIRNTASGSYPNFSALTYGLTSSYAKPTMNADKAVFDFGEWAEFVFVVTPNDGTAKANTTDVYINGYAAGLGLANRNPIDYVNQLNIQTGSADVLTYSVDDVKVYTGANPPEGGNTTVPAKLILSGVPSVMGVQDSAQAAVTLDPATSNDEVKFTVSGDAVAVTKDGFVTAVKAGTATIRAESALDGAVYDEKTVTVKAAADMVRVQGVTAGAGGVSLNVGDKRKLEVTVTPEDATEKGLVYTVLSGADAVSVSEDGELTGLAVGTARIRVTSLDNPEAYALVDVSVTKSAKAGSVIYRNDFEGGVFGSEWTMASANVQNTSVTMEGGAMNVVDANSAGQPKATLKFDPTGGQLTIRFRFKVDPTVNGEEVQDCMRGFRIAFGTGGITTTAKESFCIRSNNTYFNYNTTGSSYTTLPGDYDLTEWNTLTLVTTINASGPDTTDVYVNGVKLLEGFVNKTDYVTVDELCFSAENARYTSYHVDDLLIWTGGIEDMPDQTGEETVYENDFSEALGSEWKDKSKEDGTAQVKDGAIEITDVGEKSQPRALLTFGPVSGTVGIEFCVRTLPAEGVTDGSDMKGLRISFGTGGITTSANEAFTIKYSHPNFGYQDKEAGSSTVKMKSDTPATEWNTVRLITHIGEGTDTTDIYLNGEPIAEGLENKVSYEAIDELLIAGESSNKCHYLVDDLRIWTEMSGKKPLFKDVSPEAWYYDAVTALAEKELVDGVAADMFAPNDLATRAQAATVLYRLAKAPEAPVGSTFSDVEPGAWYAKAVGWAKENGCMAGRGDGTFGPGDVIAREDLIVALWRYAGSRGENVEASTALLDGFKDSTDISGYAVEAMAWAVEKGIIAGRGDGTLAPRDGATRAEMAEIVSEYLAMMSH